MWSPKFFGVTSDLFQGNCVYIFFHTSVLFLKIRFLQSI
eukprot:UN25067